MGSLTNWLRIESVVVVVPCITDRYGARCDDAECPKCAGKGSYQEAMPFTEFVSLIQDEVRRDDE